MQQVKQALAAADGDELAADLESTGHVRIELDGETVELSAEEVELRLVEREGTATEGDQDLLVALDTELDEALIAEGWAREVVHRIQTARKQADLDYADRIEVRFSAAEELAEAIHQHSDWIASETLATAINEVTPDTPGLENVPIDALELAIQIEIT
jgi:isoleucyl-tRNA synthetase